MEDVEVRFEPSGIEGVVPVGTYLAAAARRLGDASLECGPESEGHECAVEIVSGSENLSKVSKAEKVALNGTLSDKKSRLACFTRLVKPGEVVVMSKKVTEEKEAGEAEKAAKEEYRKKFEELPLEKKLADLVELESIALNETISFVINSPYKVADKFMDVLAEFGLSKHEAERKATRPDEQKVDDEKTDTAIVAE
jgi:uncharacterized 2Fe-2S/4Fe-4S cluster protein (DUF4445 family)